jgi:hypothetical protein
MISIIICSRTKTINPILEANIKNSIGFEYELIIIDNSENQYSIFEAYNKGIKDSKGDYLCFIHDDIHIHTQNWGLVTDRIFKENSSIGLIGVAGAKYKTKMPSSWSACPYKYHVVSLYQLEKDNSITYKNNGFHESTEEEVVVIDGVFLCLRATCNLQFDENFKGFHLYDTSLSLDCIKKGYKIVVTNQILINHFSTGNINLSWYDSAFRIHEKYAQMLPLSTHDIFIDKKNAKQIEFESGTVIAYNLLLLKQYYRAFSIWIILIKLNFFSRFHFKFWFMFLNKTSVNLKIENISYLKFIYNYNK